MKAIILAAGRGSRLGKYTQDTPKCLLRILNKPLLEIQIETLRKAGINDISVVRGYRHDKIQLEGLKYYDKRNYESTNMVVSLMTAKNELNDDTIVLYGDILYEQRLLDDLLSSVGEVVVLADEGWQKYWKMRYGSLNVDLESFIIDGNHIIKQIGSSAIKSPDEMMVRYIGMVKFSKTCLEKVVTIAEEAEVLFSSEPWKHSRNPYQKAYMTDLIQALIDDGIVVKAQTVNSGWLEFDTIEDYEKSLLWVEDGRINRLFCDFHSLFETT